LENTIVRAVTFVDQLSFDANYSDPVPGDGEALVRVHSAGICATDLHIMRGYMGFSGVPGHEMVGTVVQGSSSWLHKRVVCEINCVCQSCDMCLSGLSNHCRKRTVMGILGRDGCFADFVAIPERNLHEIPDAVSDEEAVFVEPLAAAFQVPVQVPIDSKMNVSVVGSGRLGILVAQVLAATGCRLTVIGRNAAKLMLCEKKGIQGIHLDELVQRRDRDVVVECSGSPDGLALAFQIVRPRGTVVLKSTYAEPCETDLSPAVVNEIQVIGSRCGPFPEALNALAREAIEVRSMISRIFPLEDATDAFEAAAKPENVKVLFKINPR
jgi:2-desacetyl-2-hydroxyethyl bacteriochlorophyllide A dehydrogenase